MTNQQRLIIAAVFVVALLGGGALVLMFVGGGGDGAASPSPVAVASGDLPVDPSNPVAASEPPSAPPDASPSSSADASAAPSESAGATGIPSAPPTVTPGEPATIVLTALKLDAEDDPEGRDRRITFRSQGTGRIRVEVRTLSPQGSATMCLGAGGEQLDCTTTADGRLTARTTTRREDFELTVRGDGIETPVVEVTITFPARRPAITIANARFDGTAFPETNGIQAVVTPRSDGDVTLEAAWGGHPFSYEVDLLEQGGPGAHVLADQGPATGAMVALPVTAPNPWKLLLQNIHDGFGVTPLEATIGWP